MNRGLLDWPAASSSGAGMIGGMRATRVDRSRCALDRFLAGVPSSAVDTAALLG